MEIILAPVSLGELIDKITILNIKISKLKGFQLVHAKKELGLLNDIYKNLAFEVDDDLVESLQKINLSLWQIEDAIREKESLSVYDQNFIDLARSVYIENDKRSQLKNQINSKYGSIIRDQKEYSNY